MNSDREIYDFLIVGGGPAGLTSAIIALKQGMKVALLEMGEKIGPEPRGETLHDDPILSELLGDGFMESIALSKTDQREFYAPNPKEVIIKHRKTPSIVFEWREFIDQYIKTIEKEKKSENQIDFYFNSEVVGLIEENSQIIGLKYKKEGNISEIFGNVILGCDGAKSVIGRHFKIQYSEINLPIIKCLMKNGNYESKGLKFFLVPSGSLDYAPDFPPFVLFLFPREDKNFETGMLLRINCGKKIGLKNPIPRESEIMKVWVKLKDSYPVFSDMIRGASISFEKLMGIPMMGPILPEKIAPKNNIFLIGDSAGSVEVSGGSGLVASIKMAKLITEIISQQYSPSKGKFTNISSDVRDVVISEYKGSSNYKHLKKNAKLYNLFMHLIFVKWKTKEKIMKRWNIVKLAIKLT